MVRFWMKDGCLLRSSGASLKGGLYYTAKTDAEAAELRELAKQGTCVEQPATGEEVKKAPQVAPPPPATPPADPTESDLVGVPGIGKATLDKLAAAGVTTKAQLKDALTTRADEMKAILGMNLDKVSKAVAK